MRPKYFLALAIVVCWAAEWWYLQTSCRFGFYHGKMTYTGTPLKMKPIDMSKEPSCAKQHATSRLDGNVATGPGNSLGWVVVYISAGD